MADNTPSRDERRELEFLRRRLADAERQRDEARRHLENLKQRKLVRGALGVASVAEPALRALRLRRLRRRLASRTKFVDASNPKVTVVIPTTRPAETLAPMIDLLTSRTRQPHEVVVVDNGSEPPLETLSNARTVKNTDEDTFSAACNAGAAAATGDLLLFLNDDVEPIGPGWLAAMVETLKTKGAGAVGALLIYPERSGELAGRKHPDLTVQHAGVDFEWMHGVPRPVNVGGGSDPESFRGARSVPAATAACLLVDRELFEQVGGFSTGYRYGWEDVDLCMKLRADGNAVWVNADAALFHHEFATQRRRSPEWRKANFDNNIALFTATWNPWLRNQLLMRTLNHPRFLVAGVAADDEVAALVAELEASGWQQVSEYASDRPPIVIGRDLDRKRFPQPSLRIGVEPSADERDLGYDAVLSVRPERYTGWSATKCQRPSELVAALKSQLHKPHLGITTSVPSPRVAESWGDTHFARGFARAMHGLGWTATVLTEEEQKDFRTWGFDAHLHLRGLRASTHWPRTREAIWVISHPDDVTTRELEEYDLVFAASAAFAQELTDRLGNEAYTLLQATDPERFPQGQDGNGGVVFVGNSRHVFRDAVKWAVQAEVPLRVYGAYWDEFIEPPVLAGESIPNDQLGATYAGADLVLADHWEDMRRWGFISNRVYDALAAGTLVICDDVAGLNDVFGDVVPVFRNMKELAVHTRTLLADERKRSEAAARGRQQVLDGHTFAHRAQRLDEVLKPTLLGPPDLLG